MSFKYSIGIDIGKKGAIVAQNTQNGEIFKFVMPVIGNQYDIIKIHRILSFFDRKECMCSMEDLRAIYGSSASATFSFGFGCGVIEGIIVSLGFPYRKVNAKIWQKEAFAGVPEIRKPSKKNKNGKLVKGKVDTKAMALLAVKRLYPNFDCTATELSKKEHDGIVDALLMSWWVKQNYK